MDYDPTQVHWDEAPAASASAPARDSQTGAASAGAYNGYEESAAAASNNNINSSLDNQDSSAAAAYENQEYETSATTVDG